MKIDELIRQVELIAPLDLQEPWDHSGWQLKVTNGDVSRVLVSLEVNEKVIDEAVSLRADLILSHHPLYFNGMKEIDCNNIIGNHTIRLIREGISVYSTHTPFDKCEGGNNDYLGGLIGAENIRTLPGDESGICRMGRLHAPMTAEAFIRLMEEKLRIDKRFFSFTGNLSDVIQMVGWCSGAGAEFADIAVDAGCDLFFTGDVKYHTAQYAKDIGMNLLDCGHFGTEYLFAENMCRHLDKIEKMDIIQSQVDLNPFTLL